MNIKNNSSYEHFLRNKDLGGAHFFVLYPDTILRMEKIIMNNEKAKYFGVESAQEVRENAKRLRRQYLRYKEAEIVYSIQHKKLLELAGEAGALVRLGGTVLIDRDIFDPYLNQFREPSTLITKEGE